MNNMSIFYGDFLGVPENNENLNISNLNELNSLENYDLASNKDKIYTNITNKKSLINIVIPYKNRENLIKLTINSFLNNDFQDFTITIVEYSEKSSYELFKNFKKTNFIWVPSKNDEFNKSLCMNIGSIYVDSELILFHDSDLLVESGFLSSVLFNLKQKSLPSIQTFSKGHILNISEFDTLEFLKDINYLDKIKNKLECEYTDSPPGGSIMINKNFFEEIGGFDDNIFEDWGYEDASFKLKIEFQTNCSLYNSETPIVRVFHLYHKKLLLKEKNAEMFTKIFNFNKSDLKNFIFNQSKRFENIKKIIIG